MMICFISNLRLTSGLRPDNRNFDASMTAASNVLNPLEKLIGHVWDWSVRYYLPRSRCTHGVHQTEMLFFKKQIIYKSPPQ